MEKTKTTVKVKWYDSKKGYGWLATKNLTPKDIYLNKRILKVNNVDESQVKKGSRFEVDLKLDKFRNKPSWKIISMREIISVPENFYSYLHKRELFDESYSITNKKLNPEGNWLKDGFYQAILTRHHQNALRITDEKLMPKLYNDQQGNNLKLKPDWRLAIGLGSGSVFETAITLHHIYGFPYIPSTSFKGVLRSFIIQYLFGMQNVPENEKEYPFLNSECRAYQNESFCRIFGCPSDYKEVVFEDGKPKKNDDGDYKTALKKVMSGTVNEGQEHIGDIIFFDVYPTQAPKITTDIMNPHYQGYYNGDKPPADWQSTNPILFLTVEDTPFQFLFGIRKGVDTFNVKLPNFKDEDKIITSGEGNVLEVVSNLVKNALEYHGIGAKTAVGYGYFE